MEQKDNLIQKLSYEFALKSINTYKQLVEEKREFVLSKQFLRSATSIGANIEESIG
jgi:four helix bundle protein